MNTRVEAWLYSQSDESVLLEVQRLFQSFEKRLSRFDLHSELSRLNVHTGPEGFVSSPTLLDALEVALLAAQATNGLYDPTILTNLEKAGYDRSFEQVAQPAPLQPGFVAPVTFTAAQSAWRAMSFRSIHLNRPRREITSRPACA
jgi:thiamine biosynthesis lipoprotein ApbE